MNRDKLHSIVLTGSEFESLRVNFLILISNNKKYLKKLLLDPVCNSKRISFHQSELDELETLFNSIFKSDYEKSNS